MITFVGLSPALDVTYLVDGMRPGGIHRPRTVLALPGGKSLNAARAATALGAEAHAIAPLGGFTGERMRVALAEEGIGVAVVEAAGETRACVTVIDELAADDDPTVATEFYETVDELDDDGWYGVVAAVEAVGSGWLAVSGSVPAGLAERLAELLARAPARGIRVAVDVHGPALAAVLDRAAPDIVKVNRAEAAELLGEPDAGADADAATLARGIAHRGVGLAIVTDGAAGAVGADAAGMWRATPPARGRYAVGSGDSFLAGLLVALEAEPADVPGALALATAAAAANTLRPGAGRLDPADVARLRAAVVVDALIAGGERAR